MQAIKQVEQGIPVLMEKYTQLQSGIEQRLKWASGANPALNIVMENFDQAVNEKKAVLMVCCCCCCCCLIPFFRFESFHC